MNSFLTSKWLLALLLVAVAGGLVSCGGDDDSSSDEPSASQTGTGPAETAPPSDGRSGSDRAGGSEATGPGTDQGSPNGSSGGSRAPRVGAAPRKRSLERYLAARYRQTPWYPLMRKLRIAGGHVSVYLNFSPESDDEGPPVLACTAVLSYKRQVKTVSVYGSAGAQGQTSLLKEC